MVKNEEYWIWYSLTSAYPYVDEILVFDNHSEDRTTSIIRGMEHIADKLTLYEGFGGPSEQANREAILAEVRRRGGTHLLILDGDEVHIDESLGFARRLLEVHEHNPGLNDPAQNHNEAMNHSPTDGALVKNIGWKPIHPGFDGLDTCRPQDFAEGDGNHGCYNFVIRLVSMQNLRGNGLEWGQHGYLETNDIYIQSSPNTLWLPKLYNYHFSWHPRSSKRGQGEDYGHQVSNFGSVPLPEHVHVPPVLFRIDGPTNPTFEHWGLRKSVPRTQVAVPGEV